MELVYDYKERKLNDETKLSLTDLWVIGIALTRKQIARIDKEVDDE